MRIHTIWAVEHEIVSIQEHCHNYFQMMICLGGSGAVGVDGVEYPMTEGSVCFASPMKKHFLRQENAMWLVEIKFLAEDEELYENLTRLPDNFRIESEFFFDRIRRIIAEYYNDGFCAREAVNCELYLLLIYFMRACLGDGYLSGKTRDTASGDSLGGIDIKLKMNFDKIIEYIEANIGEPLTLDYLSELVHFDKSYFTARFREICGMSPMRYVTHARIERAKVLLVTTDMTITEIARTVGFSTVHYFSRHFKIKLGVAPTEYRTLSRSRQIRKQNFTKSEILQ